MSNNKKELKYEIGLRYVLGHIDDRLRFLANLSSDNTIGAPGPSIIELAYVRELLKAIIRTNKRPARRKSKR